MRGLARHGGLGNSPLLHLCKPVDSTSGYLCLLWTHSVSEGCWWNNSCIESFIMTTMKMFPRQWQTRSLSKTFLGEAVLTAVSAMCSWQCETNAIMIKNIFVCNRSHTCVCVSVCVWMVCALNDVYTQTVEAKVRVEWQHLSQSRLPSTCLTPTACLIKSPVHLDQLITTWSPNRKYLLSFLPHSTIQGHLIERKGENRRGG